jgi:hypothetical protein
MNPNRGINVNHLIPRMQLVTMDVMVKNGHQV